ncbi:MAG: hypothetical protein WCT03_21005 [Candidatus Obscuribacterales bacterium]
MKFQETLLALSLLVIGLLSCQPARAQGNNDYAPSSAPQLETPGSLPPPAAESAGVASGGQKRHHGKGHKGKGGGAANPQKRQQMMARFDTNGDGMLDDTERAAAKAMRGQGKAGGGAGGAGSGGKRHGGKSANPADKAARRQKMMARFDTNGDGQLDATEKASLQTFREQRRQKRMQRQGGGAQ